MAHHWIRTASAAALALPVLLVASLLTPASAAPILAQTSAPTPTQTQVPQVLVEGRVVDAAGLPLSGALVGVNVSAQIPTTGVQTGADGSYSLPVAAGSRAIQAVLAGYSQLLVPTVNAIGTTSSAPDIVLYANDATVRGTVQDGSSGGVVPHALVVLSYQDGFDTVEAWSDASGFYTFGAVSGTYAAVALAQFGGAYQDRTRVTRPYSVVAGSTSVDLVLPRLSITGSPCTNSPCQMTVSGDGYVPGEPVSFLLLVQPGQVNPPANIALGQTAADSQGQISVSWSFEASPASYQLQAVEDTVPYTPNPPDVAFITVGPYVVEAPAATPSPTSTATPTSTAIPRHRRACQPHPQQPRRRPRPHRCWSVRRLSPSTISPIRTVRWLASIRTASSTGAQAPGICPARGANSQPTAFASMAQGGPAPH